MERDFLMELTIDLESISAQMLLVSESLVNGGFSAVEAVQAQAVDGWRRYLDRCIAELSKIDANYNLMPRA